MRAAEMVNEHKKEFGLPIYDEKRESEVIEKNLILIKDEVLKEYYVDYLKHLMSVFRAYQNRLQKGLKVAYSGVEGAFAHIAAGKIYPQANRVSYSDFKAAYNSVLNGECDVAVLPIENSYAGEVGQTMDLIFSGNLYVNGIYELEIRQNLLALPDATINDIKKVVSHPQALSQCHEFIQNHNFVIEEANNTAFAAKIVAESNNKSLAAIASAETAELYELEVIKANINKSSENTTRFVVLSKVLAKTKIMSNTVLMLTVKNAAGSLASAISIIAKYGYNMTALRSSPLKKQSWQYYFYIEIDGSVNSENGKQMLEELKNVCDILKIAGTFAPHTQI
jgi:chorismate mutase/prephenate dehydratase